MRRILWHPAGLVLLTVAVALAATALAARRADLRFIKATDLPGIGLRIMLMPGTHDAPLPPPTVYPYTATQGTKQWKVDMYAPEELWRESQCAGRWVDEDGNALVLAAVTLPLPDGFARQHVLREDYDKRVAELKAATTNWSPEALTAWVSAFTGARATPQPTARRPAQFRQLVEFGLDGASGHALAYAFQMNTAAAPGKAAPWFFVWLTIAPVIDTKAAHAAFMEEFLAPLGLARSAHTVQPAAGRPAAGTTNGTTRSADFAASREQVAASIRNMKNWWLAESKDYIVLSNLKSSYRTHAERILADIEGMRGIYERVAPPRQPITAVCVIRMFGAPEEYVAYVDPDRRWTSGLWVPSKKELVVKPIDFGGSREQYDAMLGILHHEAFHQYLFYAFDQIEASAWFNEGHAELFEHTVLDHGKTEVREPEVLANIIVQRIQSKSLSAEDLFALFHYSYDGFYAQDDATRTDNYALAWALVYYLRLGAPQERDAPFARIVPRYMDALWETKDGDKATAVAIEGIDPLVLHAAFCAFWRSQSKRHKAQSTELF